jgi:mono/diheme cytochrome c family protein
VRDLAMRELVQRRARAAAPAVRALLGHERAAVRIAALSVLAGLDALTATELRAGLRDPDPAVVAFVLPHTGPSLVQGDRMVRFGVVAALASPVPTVRWHAVLALAAVFDAGSAAVARVGAVPMLAALLRSENDAPLRALVATVAGAQLASVLAAIGDDWPGSLEARQLALRDLATRATKSRVPESVQALLQLATATPAWRTRAVLEGMVAALPKGAGRSGWLSFPVVPAALAGLAVDTDPDIAALAGTLLGACAITGTASAAVVAELAADEQVRVREGEVVFRRVCAACHQLDGTGMQGLAPPLRDSEWVLGPANRLVRIVLHGVKGPIEVGGVTWTMEMPGQSHLTDAEVAAVTSYVRRAFGHRQSAVAPAAVVAVRRGDAGRSEPWTATELLR